MDFRHADNPVPFSAVLREKKCREMASRYETLCSERRTAVEYREVFAKEPDDDPGHMFYTIRREDLGKNQIDTTAGIIRIGYVAGRILQTDIGKRIYWADGLWQLENTKQYYERMKEENEK